MACLLLAALLPCVRGQFQLVFGTNGPPMPTLAPGGFDPNCADQIENCAAFGSTSCSGQYEQWARDNCALTCAYCVGPATTPPPCVDVLDNCDSYGTESCTNADYSAWANENCRRTCRLCSAEVLAQLDALTTQLPPERCVDVVDCRLYGQSACTGDYASWAEENCMNYCGICQGADNSKPCLDSRPNCDQYDKDMCTNPQYAIWVEDNCPQHCGKCSGGGPGPVNTPGGPPVLTTQRPIMTPPPLGGGPATPPMPGRK